MPISNRNPLGPVPGTVAHFGASTAPAGWLKCNGAAVSRAAYAALFAAIGTTYGVGDGATTFGLPDLRGEFVRGLDDGRGVDAARAIGSAQAQAIQSHTHPVSPAYDSAWGGNAGPGYTGGNTISYSTGATGGTETRPRNVAMLACIKF